MYKLYIISYSYTVPPPTITIEGSPVDEGFHIGLILTLTAKAEYNPAVDFINDTQVSSYWTTPRTANVTNVTLIMSHPLSFTTHVTVNFQNTTKDSGLYTVWFLIYSTLYSTMRNYSQSRNITVESKL